MKSTDSSNIKQELDNKQTAKPVFKRWKPASKADEIKK